MSLLGDGASCAANANPLRQVDKVFSTDRSVQREFAHAQNHPGSLRGAERHQLSQNDQHLFQSMQQHNMDAFKLDDLRQDMPSFDRSQARNWGAEFNSGPPMPQDNLLISAQRPQQIPQQIQQIPQQNGWASEFSQQTSAIPPTAMAQGMMMSSQPQPFMSRLGYHPAFGSQINAPQMPQADVQQKEPKWEAEFERAEKQATPQEATAESVTKNTTDSSQEASTTQENAQETAPTETLADDDEKIVGVEDVDNDWLMESFPPNWNEMWDTINRGDNGVAEVRAENFRGTTGSYEFQKENEYSQEDDPFALGVYMMDNGAKLSSAVLCFEEAVKRDPSHVEAWARLGDAQAQNEIEDMAIVALERAVALNPRHEKALLNLAISYTNEGYDMAACQILEKWISSKYPDIAEITNGEMNIGADAAAQVQGSTLDALKVRVTKMFLRAAQRSPEQGMDPEVQVGLGVLFYRDEDYKKAVDCFRTALNVRPNDASLWNRLGATLANASQPEEAIDSYTRALSLRPSFVRARYNLAVSCINIGCYKEAADHILSAMALHETEDGSAIDFDRSSNLLDTLRRVFFAMDRRDLLAKLVPGASLDAFRDEFSF